MTPIPEIEEIVGKFRAGEAEVARRFFEEKRPLARHLDWLRFQVAREARNLEEIASHQRCELVEQVDRSVTREALVDQLTEDYQEVRHYGMLAYIYEGISGERVQWRELRETARQASWYAVSHREHDRWAELRAGGSELELAAALFTRGGGGSLFYGMIPLRGGDYEEALSRASKIILRDEIEHGASEGRDDLYRLIRGPADVATAIRIIAEMGAIRLEMRNEQYGRPMPAARLREIREGAIAPVTLEEMLSACPRDGEDWFEWYHERPKPLAAASVL